MNSEFRYKNELLENLMQLIKIPSVCSEEGTPGAPFGEGVARALDQFLEIAAELGFETKNYNGYAGEVNIGKGDYIIGILCHIDVVEGGKGWNTDPFQPFVKDNRVYGRGSSDNKGPMLTALYAVKCLQEDGKIPEDVTIRMIIGTDEEQAWKGIKYYLDMVSELPNISIVPDGSFPLIFCEKGLYDFNLIHDFSDNNAAKIKIESISGGDGRNIVPSEAKCVLIADDSVKDALEKAVSDRSYNGTVESDDHKVTLTIKGKSCHAMSPEKGVNAISQMLDVLSVCCDQSSIADYNRVIGVLYNGEKCGCDFEDKDSGKLTFNVGKIYALNGKIHLEANLRYPAAKDFDTIEKALTIGMSNGSFKVDFVDHLFPICFDKNGKLITLLMKAYQEATGDTKSEPAAIGGATYARAIPNAVSFGTLFPYEEELAHEANEFIDINSIKLAMDVLYKGLLLLMEEKFGVPV